MKKAFRPKDIRKSFRPKSIQHVYQRSLDRGVLFYTVADRLVYYTLAAVKSKKHNVRVYAAALMFTHIHQSLAPYSLDDLLWYLHDLDTSFVRLYNARYHRTGRLFDQRTGRSQKLSLKEKRTNLIYVYNNHVEKGLCRHAVDERWSLLAYAMSDHPFSPEMKKPVSRHLSRALKLVDRRVEAGKALEYCDLDGIFSRLDRTELQQFIDYVISRYRLVDFEGAAAHFGSLENLIAAADATTGGEYDIREDYSKDRDTGYAILARNAAANGYLRDIFVLSDEARLEAAEMSVRLAGVSLDQIRRFFRLPRE